jgi:adenosylcobinamide kinase / adenosylcobinamide-phosphate guanylyltransferase
MGKITLVTGGSRSGKSSFAEKMLSKYDDVLYVATAIPTDKDMEERIKIHKQRRNSKWETYEGYRKIGDVIKNKNHKYVLLECIGTLITDILFEGEKDFDKITKNEINALEEDVLNEIKNIILSAHDCGINLVIITNEVGMSVVSEYRLGRIFSDILGRVNQFIADNSDEVYISFCGIPLKLK